jgi:CO/xanthine dehydrogenase FAD-binding subunit
VASGFVPIPLNGNSFVYEPFSATLRAIDLGRYRVNLYAKPTSLEQTLVLLGRRPWRLLAGGTDFYPKLGAKPVRSNILDLNALEELRCVTEVENGWRFGARASWTDIVRAPLPPAFDALKSAAREIGSVQIQNAGTIAGNLCNASPAADGVPPLLTLDAEVELASASGVRLLPLAEFILGNGRTARRGDELVTAVLVPRTSAHGRAAFVKLGARRYLVISIAMVAARLVVDAGRIVQIAVAVGACSAVAQRLRGLEAVLLGEPVAGIAGCVGGYDFAELSPIEDVRGSASYRLDAARELVSRAILQAVVLDAPKAAA